MKCPQCNGRMMVIGSNPLKRGGLFARRYQCKSCDFHIETIEISKKELKRQHQLVVDLRIALKRYVTERKQDGM